MSDADEVARLNREDDAYWQGLGRFIEIFALVESAVFMYLTQEAEMPDPIARIVGAGWRTGNMLDFVAQLWKVKPPTHSPDLPDVFAQLKAISEIRNSVIHYQSLTTPHGYRISTNAGRNMPSKPPKEVRVSTELLDTLTYDLVKITTHLTNYYFSSGQPFEERVKAWPALVGAWRYTRQPGPAKKPQKPKRQRPQK